MPSVFNGRSVLVTGHTGFKGSWLALWLSRLGARVSGFALDPSTVPNNFEASRIGELLDEDVRADIRDLEALRTLIRQVKPEVIFHLAGQPIMRRAYEEPAETFSVNIMGTINLLEAVRLEHQPCVVIAVTSDKCYENQEWPWGYRESDRLGGSEPYGASKAAAELAIQAYRHTYFPPDQVARHGVCVASVRAGNVIGGGDWSPDRIVPDIVRSLSAGEPIQVRFPEAVRPWQHVLVPLSGYLRLSAGLLSGEIDPVEGCNGWNFGPLQSGRVPVRQVVEEAIACWGSGEWSSVSDSLKKHEAKLLHLNIDKAVTELGWQPYWDFRESLRRTIGWYRHYLTGSDAGMRDQCLRDIDAYEAAGAIRIEAVPQPLELVASPRGLGHP
jgi:CDP-glucose 4,6-dehydratase